MISFIIIGKNEGWKLTKCLKSVYNAIVQNQLKAEVIYVDSNSTDDSINRASEFDKIKIYKLLEHKTNAAIARNVGAKEAKGNYLCFLDGDMELFSEFLKEAFDTKWRLIHPLVGGKLKHKYYDKDWNPDNEKIFLFHKKPVFKPIAGGAFLIQKQVWDLVNGMDNRFNVSEDPELGLRLAKKGVLMKSIPSFLGIHHTMKTDKKKSVLSLFTLNHLYSSMLIYRKNLFNKFTFNRFFKYEKSLGTLIMSTFLSIVLLRFEFMLFYILALLVRSYKMSFELYSKHFIYYLLRDITCFLGFFLFFPNKIESNLLNYIKK